MSTSIISAVKQFTDRKLLTVFVFGIASGFPWVMIGSGMSAWLKEAGTTRTAIGLFGLVFAVFAVNFLWSPLVDRLKIPLLSKSLGQRRSWILTMQCGIAFACFTLASVNPASSLVFAGSIALMLSICAATQDIAIDAYRIDIIGEDEKDKMPAAAAMATSGWWTGYAGLGAIPFLLADSWGWANTYYLMCALMVGLALTVFFAHEPQSNREAIHKDLEQRYLNKMRGNSLFHKVSAWLAVTLIEPFKEFFQRNGLKMAIALLLFIFLFKMGEAFLGRMSIVFYKEIGFSNEQIGIYSKLLTWWVTIIFSLIGGVFTVRLGIVRGLVIAGIAMASSNLLFAVIAAVGPNEGLFLTTIVVDGFTQAWSSVAVVAFISLLCNRAFTATQYALMASISSVGRTFVGSSSGAFVDWLNGDWVTFFIITTLMVLPSLLFLWFIRKDLTKLEQEHKAQS